MRVREVLDLSWGAIDLENGRIEVQGCSVG